MREYTLHRSRTGRHTKHSGKQGLQLQIFLAHAVIPVYCKCNYTVIHCVWILVTLTLALALNEAKARNTRPRPKASRPRPEVSRPRPENLASRPRPRPNNPALQSWPFRTLHAYSLLTFHIMTVLSAAQM